MIRSANQLQMGTDTARGERAGRVCRFALAVDDAQDRGHPLPVGGACFCSLRQDDASLLTGRGFAPRPFSNSRTAGGRCIGIQRRRALGFLPRRLAAQSSRRQSTARRAQSPAPVDHLPCRDTDLPERHSSTSSLSHEHDPRARTITRVQEPFAFGANDE